MYKNGGMGSLDKACFFPKISTLKFGVIDVKKNMKMYSEQNTVISAGFDGYKEQQNTQILEDSVASKPPRTMSTITMPFSEKLP